MGKPSKLTFLQLLFGLKQAMGCSVCRPRGDLVGEGLLGRASASEPLLRSPTARS